MKSKKLLSEVAIGHTVRVESIVASNDLRHRLLSFGIARGTEILVKNRGIKNATIQVVVGETSLAIRKGEANAITVVEIL
jgi:Fe2+ transport system protein FeoA